MFQEVSVLLHAVCTPNNIQGYHLQHHCLATKTCVVSANAETVLRQGQEIQSAYAGTLPPGWGEAGACRSLTDLILTDTNLTGSLPPDWTGPQALQHLELSTCNFSGSLPSSWPSPLRQLDLSNNTFVGTLPEAWSQSDSFLLLSSLSLRNNQLSGTLPSCWAATALQLSDLSLVGNKLTGTIPAAWARADAFPALTQLTLTQNQLSGSLPASWPSTISVLWLDGNSFSGSLPASLSLMPQLKYIDLSDNNFTGELPAAWGLPKRFPSMQIIRCINTLLSGSLPASWGHQDAFQQLLPLSLDNSTKISGPLPSSWGLPGSFPMLQLLYLDNISLTGTIPADWTVHEAFPSLRGFYALHTNLSGHVPAFHNMNLRTVAVEGCAFNSSLSAFWTSSAPLLVARFAGNNIDGSLPENPAALNKLVALQLKGNPLQRTLPVSWLQPQHFLSHVSWLNVGNVWRTSTLSTVWRQELCLHRDTYDNDVIQQELAQLPELQNGFGQEQSQLDTGGSASIF